MLSSRDCSSKMRTRTSRPMMSDLAVVLRQCAAGPADDEDYDPPKGGGANQTLIIIDQHSLPRAAMETLFSVHLPDWTISAIDGVEALTSLPNSGEQSQVFVLVCLGSLPVTDGVEDDIARIKEYMPHASIMLLGDLDSEEQMSAAMASGVNAYLPTSVDPEVVTRLVAAMHHGCIFVHPTAKRGRVSKPEQHRNADPSPTRIAQLPLQRRTQKRFTPRELQVLQCLRHGMQNKVIAYKLDLQESTVKVHVRSILKKLDVHTRTQAALLASKNGIGDEVPSSAPIRSERLADVRSGERWQVVNHRA